jgi:integrase
MHRFVARAQALAWCALAVDALLAGRPLPAASLVTPAVPVPAAGHDGSTRLPSGMSVQDVIDDFLHETFDLFPTTGGTREEGVRGQIINYLAPFVEVELADGTLQRAPYRDFVAALTSPAIADIVTGYRTRHAGSARVIGVEGRRRGPRTPEGNSAAYAGNLRQILDRILRHGVAIGGWSIGFDLDSVPNPVSSRQPKQKADPITYQETARMARHMHAVHQLALWMLRILGLRISEAYGVLVRDVIRLGDGSGRGLLLVDSQGGRTFTERVAGALVKATTAERTKTPQSVRVIGVPALLMALFDVVIAIFHTDPDTGRINLDARLIPGLASDNAGGQASLRNAFKRSATAEGITRARRTAFFEKVFGAPTPHDMRSSAITELAWADVPELLRKRYAGHVAGSDVHAGYVADDSRLVGLLQVTDQLDAQLMADVAGTLQVPTTVRCTTGAQKALVADGERIDADLRALGWLLTPGDEDRDDPWVTTGEAAALLDRSVTTVNRQARAGEFDSRPARAIGGMTGGRLIRLADVLAADARQSGMVTYQTLADELHISSHRLRNWVQRFGMATEADGVRGIRLPDSTVAELRRLAAVEVRLREVGMTDAQAATALGVTSRTVGVWVDKGVLQRLPESGPDGRAYLTRSSVHREAESRRARRSGSRRGQA